MADDENARKNQAESEERRQRERAVAEHLDRYDEPEHLDRYGSLSPT